MEWIAGQENAEGEGFDERCAHCKEQLPQKDDYIVLEEMFEAEEQPSTALYLHRQCAGMLLWQALQGRTK